MIYVHFGAGAGDLDPRANYRCGFTEFIKKNYQAGDEIYLIEVNKNNIEKLKKCWVNYQNSYIFNTGIVTKEHEEGIVWNDETLNIPWPVDKNKIILSEKDEKLPNLGKIE